MEGVVPFVGESFVEHADLSCSFRPCCTFIICGVWWCSRKILCSTVASFLESFLYGSGC